MRLIQSYVTNSHDTISPKRMSNVDHSMLRRAVGIANVSTMRQRHGAIITKNSRVLGIGINVQRNDPAIMSENPNDISYHAEVMAVRSVKNKDALRGSTLFVARVNKANMPVLSKPCPACRAYLHRYGIKVIIHT